MLKVVDNVVPCLAISSSTAIIGSSSSMKKRGLGDYIDSFVDVVRFNRAPTEGWEAHVGSKTTLRVTNNHVFANVKHNVGGDDNCEDWRPEGQPQYFIKNLQRQRILLLNKDRSAWVERHTHLDESSQGFLGDYDKIEAFGETSSPSVGFAFIALCVMNRIKPTLFGFGLSENDDKASHYWEDKDKISSSHGYKLERKNIKKWQETGKLLIK